MSSQQSGQTLPPETLEFAAKCFDMARDGNTETLQAYLGAGLPPNLTNEKGNTLFMLAAYNGRHETAKMLAQKGADVNRLNDRGQSPLAGAIFKGEEGMVRLLIELGANPRAGNPNAIDSAKIFGQLQYLDLLGAMDEERNQPIPNQVSSAANLPQ